MLSHAHPIHTRPGRPACRARASLSVQTMNAYTALLGLVALLLLHAAWRERTRDNHRDAKALTVCGAGFGALAAAFTLFL